MVPAVPEVDHVPVVLVAVPFKIIEVELSQMVVSFPAVTAGILLIVITKVSLAIGVEEQVPVLDVNTSLTVPFVLSFVPGT